MDGDALIRREYLAGVERAAASFGRARTRRSGAKQTTGKFIRVRMDITKKMGQGRGLEVVDVHRSLKNTAAAVAARRGSMRAAWGRIR